MTHSQLVNHACRAAREVEFDGKGAYEIAAAINSDTKELSVVVRGEGGARIEVVLSEVSEPVIVDHCIDDNVFWAFVKFMKCMEIMEGL